MAAKMLSYNQCQTQDENLQVASEIIVIGPDGKTTNTSVFPLGYTGSLSTLTSTGNWIYTWTLSHPQSSTVLTGTGVNYPINQINQCGTWIGVVEVRDPITNIVVSTSHATFTVICSNEPMRLSVNIRAMPLTTIVGNLVDFTPFVTGGSGTIRYAWNFGDGTTTSEKNPKHGYQSPRIYTVTLTVVDALENTATAHAQVLVL